jgi:hypothetical protein
MRQMIDAVTKAIVAQLARETADLGDWIKVSALNQDVATPPAKDTLHVALYGIEEHGHMRNRPLEESIAGGLVRPPMLLRLQYVIVYMSELPLEAQMRLWRVIQVFHTTPRLQVATLDPELAKQVQTLTVRLRAPTLDERNQLWTALHRPLLPAVYYEVDVAPVPVTQREGAGRVKTLELDYAEA